MRSLVSLSLLLLLSVSAFALTDQEIDAAIASGNSSTVQRIWKDITKHRQVRINRAGFGDTVGKQVTFVTDSEAISLAAADRHRRHQELTVEEVKSWPDLGTVRVLLTTEATGMYQANMRKWQAPEVHMTLTMDGKEVQPLSEGASRTSRTAVLPTQHGILSSDGHNVSYTPLYESAIYDVAHSRTWFVFPLPGDPSSLSVTVISSDGHEKTKQVSADLLTP